MKRVEFSVLAQHLAERADEQNDAADHDELHAASDVCTILTYMPELSSNYIERWLIGLKNR